MRNIDQMTNTTIVIALLILCCLVITACAPTVKVETPKEPITINLDADIRVKLEEEAKKDIAANPGIF